MTDSFICPFCNKSFNKRNGLGVHKRQCSLNPNRQPNVNLGRPAWNKGLTSETSEKVAKSSKK